MKIISNDRTIYRRTSQITAFDEKKSIFKWAEDPRRGERVDARTIAARLNKGWDQGIAITRDVQIQRPRRSRYNRRKSKDEMIRITVHMTEWLAAKVIRKANDENKTRSKIINQILEKELCSNG